MVSNMVLLALCLQPVAKEKNRFHSFCMWFQNNLELVIGLIIALCAIVKIFFFFFFRISKNHFDD